MSEGARYQADPHPGGTNRWIVAAVRGVAGGRRLRVLDLGCASGYLGERLVRDGHVVDGIDLDPANAAVARQRGFRRVEIGDVATATANLDVYDVVVAADVLEHVAEPGQLLRRLRDNLAEDGVLVASLPNVAHLSVRLALLAGRFEYRETGILDRTHLRFFTFETAQRLFADNGWKVDEVAAASRRFGPLINRHPRLGRALRGSLAYQVLLRARPTGRPGPPSAGSTAP